MVESPDFEGSIIESLKSLSLTKYEALVYVALLSVDEATATEIHELSGVPRASVYPVLDRLVQKQLVNVSHTTPKRFDAISPDDGINTLLQKIEEDAKTARAFLVELYQRRTKVERGSQDLIWNIKGESNISSRFNALCSGAKKSIYIVAHWPFLKRRILPGVDDLPEDVDIEIISDDWEGPFPTGIRILLMNPVYKHPDFGEEEAAALIIIDNTKAMVVMGAEDSDLTALFSESPGFVQFFSRYRDYMRRMVKNNPQ